MMVMMFMMLVNVMVHVGKCWLMMFMMVNALANDRLKHDIDCYTVILILSELANDG